MTKENSELKCEVIRQRQPTTTVNHVNEAGDMKQLVRPVSMYETREGPKNEIKRNTQVRSLLCTTVHTYQVQKLMQLKYNSKFNSINRSGCLRLTGGLQLTIIRRSHSSH